LTRWKKDETTFHVALSFDGTNSKRCRIPKPIIDFLGDPESLKFVIHGKKIQVITGDK
jgi:hypothetical protein